MWNTLLVARNGVTRGSANTEPLSFWAYDLNQSRHFGAALN
jgi:hypothetical protein